MQGIVPLHHHEPRSFTSLAAITLALGRRAAHPMLLGGVLPSSLAPDLEELRTGPVSRLATGRLTRHRWRRGRFLLLQTREGDHAALQVVAVVTARLVGSCRIAKKTRHRVVFRLLRLILLDKPLGRIGIPARGHHKLDIWPPLCEAEGLLHHWQLHQTQVGNRAHSRHSGTQSDALR